MTDFNATTPTPSSAPAAPAAAPAPGATDVVSRADYERLQRESQSHRERAQAAERSNPLAGLAPEDAQAIAVLARSIQSGDTTAAVAWMVDNAKALSNGDLSRFLDPAAAAPTPGEVRDMADGSGLTPAQVREMIAQAKAEARDEALSAVDERSRLQQLDQALSARGIAPGSPEAVSLMAFAMETNRTVEQAHADWVNRQLELARTLTAQVQAAQSAGQPSGGRGYTVPAEGSSKERLMAAVRGSRMGGV